MEQPNKTENQLVASITSQMKELVAIKDSFNGDQVKFIKGLVNPDLTDNELYMFLVYAGKAGLNPFTKEIIAIVYNKDDLSKRRVNTIVTRDGKRGVAYRMGGVDGISTEAIYIKETDKQEGTEGKMVKCEAWEGGKLWGATCIVTRNGKNFVATVPLSEYNTGMNLWTSKPSTMIKKVAESQALSMAVPELLGLYDEAEMGQDTGFLPAGADDDEPATDAQKLTAKGIVEKNKLDVDVDHLTKGQYKEIVNGLPKKK